MGRHDGFFELGGHSLHGISLAERVAEKLGVRLSAVAIFLYPTIKRMAEIVRSSKIGRRYIHELRERRSRGKRYLNALPRS